MSPTAQAPRSLLYRSNPRSAPVTAPVTKPGTKTRFSGTGKRAGGEIPLRSVTRKLGAHADRSVHGGGCTALEGPTGMPVPGGRQPPPPGGPGRGAAGTGGRSRRDPPHRLTSPRSPAPRRATPQRVRGQHPPRRGFSPRRSRRPGPAERAAGGAGGGRGLAHLLARQPEHLRRRRRHGRAARVPRRRVYLRPAPGPAPRPPRAPPCSSSRRLIGARGLGPTHPDVCDAF